VSAALVLHLLQIQSSKLLLNFVSTPKKHTCREFFIHDLKKVHPRTSSPTSTTAADKKALQHNKLHQKISTLKKKPHTKISIQVLQTCITS
jgi:hypothetical protein